MASRDSASADAVSRSPDIFGHDLEPHRNRASAVDSRRTPLRVSRDPDPDVGLQALDVIHRVLMIDNEWTSRGNRRFNWYAFRLEQAVEASPFFDDGGFLLSRIQVITSVVENVQLPGDQVVGHLGALNRETMAHALVYRDDERRIDAMLSHMVHAETMETRAREIASAQIAMLAIREHIADGLAELMKGTVAARAHPIMGRREVPDDMLGVLERHFAPLSEGASSFAVEAEIEAIHTEFRDSPVFTEGGSSTGIALEVAFGEDETTLVQLVTSEKHPIVGAGLGVFTTVRWIGTPEECGELANTLNLRHHYPFEVVPGFGAWCSRYIGEICHLAHSRFIPDADFLPMRALDSSWTAINQARWLDSMVYPGLPERSAAGIVVLRSQMERGARNEN